jgi:hypothetical protein
MRYNPRALAESLSEIAGVVIGSAAETVQAAPGNDDAERPGWDGLIEASEGTPWIPSGRSRWEFGTNEDPKAKAESDFEKSVKALEKKEREETTFVFVTPRRWTGKTSWVTAKKAKRRQTTPALSQGRLALCP